MRVRAPGLSTEQSVGPLEGGWWKDGKSDPIDIVITGPWEFYDCKNDVRRIESKHINQFNLLNVIDRSSIVGFITLAPAPLLADSLEDLGFPHECAVHAYTLEDFEAMAVDKPTSVVA